MLNASRCVNEIHFGGPDQPPGRLRDLLAERVAAVPAGGCIDWVTYYFRDRRLAAELLRAHRRGVRVTVTLEGRPRSLHANDAVAAMLAGPDGLGKAFRTLAFPGIPLIAGGERTPHLHEKLYCFSHPRPVAFIGSFNPSGDIPEDDPGTVRAIGDQDRGHNVLVGLYDPRLVTSLLANARRIHGSRWTRFHRFSIAANRTHKGEETEIHFWPKVGPHPVRRFLDRIAPGARIRVVASHLKGKSIAKALIGIARRGAAMEILAEPTQRRVPAEIEGLIRDAGIAFRRVSHASGVPMHNKFMLVEKNGSRWVIFGSFNWTARSYWLNYEIGAISVNHDLFTAFAERWEVLKAQTI